MVIKVTETVTVPLEEFTFSRKSLDKMEIVHGNVSYAFAHDGKHMSLIISETTENDGVYSETFEFTHEEYKEFMQVMLKMDSLWLPRVVKGEVAKRTGDVISMNNGGDAA